MINFAAETANFYQFSSVEVKQLSFRIDGVFLPNNENQPIYFVEIQFQPDNNLYSRFLSEIFLYLYKADLSNDWRGVIIYPHRGVDTGDTSRYQEFFDSERVSRLYLNELGDQAPASVGLATLQLIIMSDNDAIRQGKKLIQKVREEFDDANQRQELLQLIETILIYKLPQANRKEIEAMFSLSDLKQTKVYQEALEEGEQRGEQRGEQKGEQRGKQKAKLESIPRMLKLGLSVEIIAESLDLPLEVVQQEASKLKKI